VPPASANKKLQRETFEAVWTRVGESYPDPDMNGVDWAAAHDELLPAAKKAKTSDDLRPVLLDLLGRLGQSHFQVVPATAYGRVEALRRAARLDDAAQAASGSGPGTVGIHLRLVEDRATVVRIDAGSAADEAGIEPGWWLTQVGDLAVADTVAEALADEQPSTRMLLNGSLQHLMTGVDASEVSLTLEDGARATHEHTLTRSTLDGQAVQFGELPELLLHYDDQVVQGPPKVGLVRFNMFMMPVPSYFEVSVTRFKATEDLAGLVIDLRGNPGGLSGISQGISGWLVKGRGKMLGTMRMRDTTLNMVVHPRVAAQRYDGPVAILIDGMSASTSEILAGGLQELGRAHVVGQTSAGQALPSMFELLPNGDRLQFAFADLTTPSGYRIEGQGVVPDTAIELTREALLAGTDQAMSAAIAWIAQQETTP
jgi:carboxyl-terminal processing protease